MGSHYEAQDGTKVAFDASPLATDFLQSFSYERVKELVSCYCNVETVVFMYC